MVQVKKDVIRVAILKSAKKLYSKNDYVNTSMSMIAKDAKISTSNLYNYFESKMEILYEVYTPWIKEHMRKLEKQIVDISDPRERLEVILSYIWKEIPASDRGYANNINQALSTLRPGERYDRSLLLWIEEFISRLIEPAVKTEYKKYIRNNVLAHLIIMTYDGYVMNYKLTKTKGDRYAPDRAEEVIQVFSDFLVSARTKINKRLKTQTK